MAALYLDNLLHWTGQVMVIGALGLILPLILRVRHPRSQLLYCHFLLAVCVLLPLIQPWRHLLIVIGHATTAASTLGPNFTGAHVASAGVAWNVVVLWILLAGTAARLCWLALGLWRIRRYRVAATPLIPIPAAVEAASALTQTDALVCSSSSAPGPVTLGFFHPIVLLPESFRALGEEAQCAIVCHELLHVRRHDWLLTVSEEIAAALLWFNPAIWWLLAHTRLAREQVVDEEVVRLTRARDPYLDALLAIAGKRTELDLVPVPSFLRRRHLTHRIHYLLKEASMSKLRLLISYAAIAAVLAMAGWFTLAALPLVGSAQVKEAQPPDEAGVSVDPGGTILHRAAVPYPPAALYHHIEGTVVAELTLRKNGEVADAHVLSGPEDLRAAVLWSVLQWHYATEGQSPQTVQVTVNFSAPNSANSPAPNPQMDASANSKETYGILASIDVGPLPEPLQGAVWEKVKSFQGQPFSNFLMRQVEKAVSGLDSHMGFRWQTSKDGTNQTLTLFLAPSFIPAPPFDQLSFEPRASSETTKQFPSSGAPRIVVGGGVMEKKLVHKVDPVYPPLAKAAGIRGTVVLDVLIASDGSVDDVRLSQGPTLLAPSAIEALKQWTYKPTTIGGTPVEVVTQVRVPFGTE
jgi:TonB family protein